MPHFFEEKDMNNSFVRKSNLTHEEYDYFKTVKIKNVNQASAYIEHDVFPEDIRVERTEDNKRVIVFYFDKEKSKDVFDKWCNYELK